MPGMKLQNIDVRQHQGAQRTGLRWSRDSTGGGGRRGSGGSGLPPMPHGDDLGEFVQFVYDLLKYWIKRVEQGEFTNLDLQDRKTISRGWADFEEQWKREHDALMRTIAALPVVRPNDMKRCGLVGPAMAMKLHFVRKCVNALKRGYERVTDALTIREAWHRTFETADVILDSAKGAVSFVPGASAIVSGLKEFKDTAMGLSKVVQGNRSAKD